MNDIERFLILNMTEDLGSVRTLALLRHFGSPDRIFNARANELTCVTGIGEKIAFNLTQAIKGADFKKEMDLIRKHRIKVITFLDNDYPKNLKNIYDPPMVLYVKGNVLPQDDLAVAIVGSRLASFYGIQQAERFAFELASRGITIVSGLARGIDSSAHKGALKAKGRTLAILGSGLLNVYPEEHKALAEEISENGAVISEFPMATIPDRGNFPKRNRIVSGLSLGVVVVEAAKKSGALITSDIAMEEGRDVFAVPGKIDSITSKGTNKLIKQGAKLTETVGDILEELGIEASGSTGRDRSILSSKLDKSETLVYNLLSSEPKHIDELSVESGVKITELSGILFNLEIKRFARQLPGKNFVKEKG